MSGCKKKYTYILQGKRECLRVLLFQQENLTLEVTG